MTLFTEPLFTQLALGGLKPSKLTVVKAKAQRAKHLAGGGLYQVPVVAVEAGVFQR